MIPLAIHGIGPVGAFGAGLNEFQAALKGDKKVEPEFMQIKTDLGFHKLAVFNASCKALKAFVKNRELRRLDHFSKLALLGATLACEDAGLHLIGERTGLIIASAYGATSTTFSFLDSIINDGDALASPTLFSNSVNNAAAAHVARHFQITGPNLSLTQGQLSVPMALLTAAQWLAQGRVDTVLCGAVEEYCEVLGYCWQSDRNQKESRNPNKNYATTLYGPGEGSIFFWLSRAEGVVAAHGYLEKLEFGQAVTNNQKPNDSTPIIANLSPFPDNTQPMAPQNRNLWEIDFSRVTGSLPIAPAFNLAATTMMLNEQTIYSHDPENEARDLSFSGNTIRYRQAESPTPRNRLTGSCYWITNRLNP